MRLLEKSAALLTLFTSLFYISAVTFGSGYVIIPVIKKRFVDELKWIEEDEMLNMIALAQSSPGVMTANTALLVGYKVRGPIGAVLAVLGTALPPLITISVIAFFYENFRGNAIVSAVLKGMQAGVCAVIAEVVFDMVAKTVKSKKAVQIFIMLAAFIASFVFRVNVIFIILTCAVFGVFWYFFSKIMKLKNDIV